MYPDVYNTSAWRYSGQEKDVDWMDLDAIQTGNKGKKLSKKQIAHLPKIGACFKCKQVGHTMKQCLMTSNPGKQNPQALYQAYPAMSNMANMNHKASRKSGINNINVE